MRILLQLLFSILLFSSLSCVNDSNLFDQINMVDPVENTYLNQIGFEIYQAEFSNEYYFRMETEDEDCPFPQITVDYTLEETSLTVFVWRVEFVEIGIFGCGPGSSQLKLPFTEGAFNLIMSNHLASYSYDITLDSGNADIELTSVENTTEHDFFVIGYPN